MTFVNDKYNLYHRVYMLPILIIHRKCPKSFENIIYCCNYPKNITKWTYYGPLQDTNEIINMADPDQSALMSCLSRICSAYMGLSVQRT